MQKLHEELITLLKRDGFVTAKDAERMARFNRGLKALQDSGRVSQYLLEIQQPLSLTY